MKNKLIYIIIGIIIGFSSAVIAESINSNEVLYDNSNSSSNKENVQDALDNLYNIVDHGNVVFSLLERNPSKLSTQLVGGLYRYQGVQDANNNVDNYICFGTTNKSDCISDTDKYMYRIIGINTNGQLKLIKKEALNTVYKWNTSYNVDWAHSELYAGLNGSYFLTNTTYVPDNSWSNRIVASDWHYLTTTDSTVSTIAERELGATDIVNAKIGLMYLHDYAYALANPAYSNTSWIHLSKNDASAPNSSEWTISRYDTYTAWRVNSPGDVSYGFMTYTYSVRPVFYLRSGERIASGSGTITDPYVLSA